MARVEFHNLPCEEYFPTIEDGTLGGIFSDPPYNVSAKDIIGNEKSVGNMEGHKDIRRDLGDWDKGFDPGYLVRQAERVLMPGGWLVVCCGDMTHPVYHTLIKESTWLHYKATIIWIKANPTVSVRKANFSYSTEMLDVGIKGTAPIKENPRENPRLVSLDTLWRFIEEEKTPINFVPQLEKWMSKLPKSTKVKPIAWNWLGQANMYNRIDGPTCMGNERLYWHNEDGVLIPCTNPRKCPICERDGNTEGRIGHPTQKPLYLWKWLYQRMTKPGMVIYDPYAGVATSGIASTKFGLEWLGTEIDPTYHAVGSRFLDGRWTVPEDQINLFEMDELF